MVKTYKLKNHEVVECSLRDWQFYFSDDAAESADRRLVSAYTLGKITISTIFIGLDYNFTGNGPPLVFETRVFGGTRDGDIYRYATYDAALKNHNRLAEELRTAGDKAVNGPRYGVARSGDA